MLDKGWGVVVEYKYDKRVQAIIKKTDLWLIMPIQESGLHSTSIVWAFIFAKGT